MKKLLEVVKEISRKKNLRLAKEKNAFFGVGNWKRAFEGEEWEQHWQKSAFLLRECEQLGIDVYGDMPPREPNNHSEAVGQFLTAIQHPFYRAHLENQIQICLRAQKIEVRDEDVIRELTEVIAPLTEDEAGEKKPAKERTAHHIPPSRAARGKGGRHQ